ncbi:MAG: HAD family hydrolase [Terracidiphilus sp.]|nr:HAD family hydrolase [Terracidiphilus sp.]
MSALPPDGMPSPLKAVVFDLDDTLYLEQDYVLSGFRHLSGLVAADAESSPQQILSFLNTSAADPRNQGHILDLLLTEYPGLRTAWDACRLIEEYRCHTPTISLLPGVEPMLSELRAAGVRLGVITDGASESQHRKARALGLATLVDMLIVTDDKGIEYRKPHPYAYLYVAERFGLEPAACAYVGDNPAKDFLAPRRLGWETVRIRLSYQLHEAAEPLSPEAAPRVESRGMMELRCFLISRLSPTSAKKPVQSFP